MATTFTPPPTFSEIITWQPDGSFLFNPIWLKWFVDLAAVLSEAGVTAASVNGGFSHNALKGIQGGLVGESYHVNAGQFNLLAGGITSGGAFSLAKLTVGGNNGYIQFSGGIIVGAQAPT